MLPPPTPSFQTRKSRILSQLSVPDAEYTDASPKGSVDVAIRELIDEINHGYEGLVTTSSCAGRVSVYLEGVKRKKQEDKSSSGGDGGQGEGGKDGEEEEGGELEDAARAATVTASSSGGKGGGEWLFVSHDPLETVDPSTGREHDGKHWMEVFGLTGGNGSGTESGDGDGEEQQEQQQRLIHFKFEPMILHILTTSPSHAHLAIQSGMTSGFRETGAVSILPRLTAPFFSSCHQCHTHQHHQQPQQPSLSSSSTPPPAAPNSSSAAAETTATNTPNPIVAIRSMGLSFESLIGAQRGSSQRQALVSPEYLSLLVKIANERFEENKKRIARLREALRLAFGDEAGAGVEEKKKKGGDAGDWEDAEARKQRKREEGLARREEVRRRKEEERERKRREEEGKQQKQEDEGKQEIKEGKEGKVDLAEVVLQVPDVL